MTVRIVSIADHLDLAPEVGRWHFEEWSQLNPIHDVDSFVGAIRARTNRDRIPTTLLALEGERPVGSACLVECDMKTRRDLTPWLSGVYVLASHRRRGIGTRLVRETMVRAKEFGVEVLYLHTDGVEDLYAKLGWREESKEFYEGGMVTIMSVTLVT